MRLLFFRAQYGTPYDRLYAWLTNGSFSRIAIELEDGRCFGVNYSTGRFHWVEIKGYQWYSRELYAGLEEVRDWCFAHIGKDIPELTWWKVFLLHFINPMLVRDYIATEIGKALTKAGYEGISYVLDVNKVFVWAEDESST